ncbi:dimethyladenosine transferase 1, mitochondrial [Chelonus insularis]|uniref:dimethyladenosine transferase 1, mitochondrial n=1 Tax=Chelonus insularis TaxID=460826 RepID=UPI00158B28E0|nr:dimethyladenosine transferase 1, mitochondrial [Chelonus insularis]
MAAVVPKIRFPPLPSVPDLLKLYRLRARKQLSQNFLLNERITRRFVNSAGKLKDAHVIEVGPGPGPITRSIMNKFPQRIIVVEKDKRFKPTLEMLAESFATVDRKMTIVFNDIRKVDMSEMLDESLKENWDGRCPRIYVLGNLPFSVSTPLIIQWLRDISKRNNVWKMGRARLCLTFQKEVAERIVANVRNRQRCRLSVMAQAWTNPTYCFTIRGVSFIPKPEVDVGVVRMEPLVKPRTSHDFDLFEKITRHVFCFRQKHVIFCLRTLFPPYIKDDLALLMLNLADLDPGMRSFELSVEDIDRLCTAYKYVIEKHPELKDYNYRASRKILSKNYTQNIEVSEFPDDEEDEEEFSDELEDIKYLVSGLEESADNNLKST